MSHASCTSQSFAVRQIVKRTAYAALTILALGAPYASAKENARDFKGNTPANMMRNCRPANGGEIRFGFAGSGDWVNPATGNICYTDHRPIAF